MFSSIFLSRMQHCCCHCTPFPLCGTTQWIIDRTNLQIHEKLTTSTLVYFPDSFRFNFSSLFSLIRFAIWWKWNRVYSLETCCSVAKRYILSTQSTNKSISNSFSFTFSNVVSNRHTRISNRLTWNMKISASHMHTQARTAVLDFAPN